ncbi:3D domain-containing protein [Cellulophaga baltica]|uniref:3D domain-containing protein n=1 Tax=Cellulophaga TaxID=104264 RepID=UPI001C07846B|nr:MULTISPECIES: 3D domain-containing protein [Cellulophaga]MBU2996241.1 3D domain-containing protein [Cellulophaga baltica]MDO6767636.1 3D domain-containing protein [Cellulophaga sp. 1_MG-2023]
MISCGQKEKEQLDLKDWIPLDVTVTAYNTFPSQTTAYDSDIAAWGDTLKPGMKAIAISRDLLRKGLDYNTMVRIDTIPDTFYVKDKMHFKHRNKIDIFMGKNKQKALDWGRRKLTIFYFPKKDSLTVKDTVH